ncbi:MAG: DNA modification methylase [Planctomycetes bacterium]|nr:DNA modification methylase [Planctomycetota bacterium]
MEQKRIEIIWVPVADLHCNPTNPRINEPAVPHVAASIKRFGWRQPIVAKPDGEVIAGNTRLKAALSLDLDEVPVVWFEGDETEAKAFAIADNRTAEFATWDLPALNEILQELKAEDALGGVGYSEDDIDDLIAEISAALPPVELEDPGPDAPPKTPVTATGDLWLLGAHRLLCGDSTSAADISRLLGSSKPVLLSTDPPYCVDYTGADRPQDAGKDWSDTYKEVEIKDLGEFLRAMFKAVLPHLKPNAGVYIWHAHLQYPTIAKVFEEFNILCHQPIIWVKPSSTFSYSYFRWKHEPCLFGWQQGNKPPHYLENGLTSVWECDWEGKSRIVGNEHPTQKPLRLFEIPMEQHSRRNQVVLEPFSGSGSQLLAAEKLGRKCCAMEITPAFVDVAIRRWEKATGKTATLEDTKQTYAETAKARGVAIE